MVSQAIETHQFGQPRAILRYTGTIDAATASRAAICARVEGLKAL